MARKTNLARLLARRPFSCSPGTGALRRDRARERGGRAAAWPTIRAGLTIATPVHQTTEDNATMRRPTPKTSVGNGQLQRCPKPPTFERRDPELTASPE